MRNVQTKSHNSFWLFCMAKCFEVRGDSPTLTRLASFSLSTTRQITKHEKWRWKKKWRRFSDTCTDAPLVLLIERGSKTGSTNANHDLNFWRHASLQHFIVAVLEEWTSNAVSVFFFPIIHFLHCSSPFGVMGEVEINPSSLWRSNSRLHFSGLCTLVDHLFYFYFLLLKTVLYINDLVTFYHHLRKQYHARK